jgi:hypothetical protein
MRKQIEKEIAEGKSSPTPLPTPEVKLESKWSDASGPE